MKMTIWGAVATAAMLASGAAMAENNIYLGGSVTQYDIHAPGINLGNGIKPRGVQFVFGGDVAKYAGVEARVGRSVSYGEIPRLSEDVDGAKIDNTFGLYGKAQYPLAGGMVKPYAIFGFSKYDYDTHIAGKYESVTDSDFSTGFGISILPTKHLQLSAEFLRVSDESQNGIGKIYADTISVAYVFGN